MKIDPPVRKYYRGPVPLSRDYRKINRKKRRAAFLGDFEDGTVRTSGFKILKTSDDKIVKVTT